jgi:hypothetical protein
MKHCKNIPENSTIHDHNTRRKKDLHTQSCRTSSFQKSVINTGIKLFNHLPLELKQIHELKQLKKKIEATPTKQATVFS